MKLKVKLWGQLKHLTGQEIVDVEAGTVDEVVKNLAVSHSEISHFLVAEDQPNQSILVFVNDTQHVWGSAGNLSESDSITIMSPIAGG